VQYRDGHISPCLIKTLVIYSLCICAGASYYSLSLFVNYLFVLIYSLLLSVHCLTIYSVVVYLISHQFCVLLFKREKNNSDPELCSGISILQTIINTSQ
jgi:hypothetical protein